MHYYYAITWSLQILKWNYNRMYKADEQSFIVEPVLKHRALQGEK